MAVSDAAHGETESRMMTNFRGHENHEKILQLPICKCETIKMLLLLNKKLKIISIKGFWGFGVLGLDSFQFLTACACKRSNK